jgi:hypothetical protein
VATAIIGCVASVVFLSVYCLQAQQQTALQNLQALKLPSSKNLITVYYSPGFEPRVLEVRPLVEEMMSFYQDRLKIKADFTLAILTKAHWSTHPEAAKRPYGVPFVTGKPSVAFVHATADNAVTSLILKYKERLPSAKVEEVEASGFNFDAAAVKFVDLIGLHELGHVYTAAYDIDPQNKWLSELLANYFAYAFLREKQAKLGLLFKAMNSLGAPNYSPKYRSLDDFERLYSGVGVENYGWYQATFTQKAVKVYEKKGLSFLADVRRAFPQGKTEQLTVQVVLQRLEAIHPRFVEWSNSLEK